MTPAGKRLGPEQLKLHPGHSRVTESLLSGTFQSNLCKLSPFCHVFGYLFFFFFLRDAIFWRVAEGNREETEHQSVYWNLSLASLEPSRLFNRAMTFQQQHISEKAWTLLWCITIPMGPIHVRKLLTASCTQLESPAQLSPPFIFTASQSLPKPASNPTFPHFKRNRAVYWKAWTGIHECIK